MSGFWSFGTHCVWSTYSSPQCSAIETLVCNLGPQYGEQWEVPVTVKSGPDSHKIIVLDKPLVKKAMTAREKNNLYFEKVCVEFSL